MILPSAFIALLALAAPKSKSDVPAEKPIKPLPTLSKEPKLDGSVKDFAAADLKVSKEATGRVSLKAAFRKDTLYLMVQTKDSKVTMGDSVVVNLYFPSAGTTARGFRYLFGPDGRRNDTEGAPAWAQALVKSAVKTDDKGLTLELAFPARSLPRMPATLQLALNVCIEVANQDEGAEAKTVSTCNGPDMVGGSVRLPDELRKNLKLLAPADVEGLEARPDGWVGYAMLHYPTWVIADASLTPESLGSLIAGEGAIDPKSVQLPLPPSMTLNDNRPIYTVLTGTNPYVGDQCHSGDELRMAMYVIKGNTGARVLEWPAATCALGRAMSFELNPDGGLSIGYTNGSTAHFSWSGDHFERSELGQK